MLSKRDVCISVSRSSFVYFVMFAIVLHPLTLPLFVNYYDSMPPFTPHALGWKTPIHRGGHIHCPQCISDWWCRCWWEECGMVWSSSTWRCQQHQDWRFHKHRRPSGCTCCKGESKRSSSYSGWESCGGGARCYSSCLHCRRWVFCMYFYTSLLHLTYHFQRQHNTMQYKHHLLPPTPPPTLPYCTSIICASLPAFPAPNIHKLFLLLKYYQHNHISFPIYYNTSLCTYIMHLHFAVHHSYIFFRNLNI